MIWLSFISFFFGLLLGALALWHAPIYDHFFGKHGTIISPEVIHLRCGMLGVVELVSVRNYEDSSVENVPFDFSWPSNIDVHLNVIDLSGTAFRSDIESLTTYVPSENMTHKLYSIASIKPGDVLQFDVSLQAYCPESVDVYINRNIPGTIEARVFSVGQA